MANDSGFINKKRIDGEPEEIYTGQKRPSMEIAVDVDVSNAIKGLKAVQREAKEATKALRDLENTKSTIGVFYIAFPRTLWTHKTEHGVWDIFKNDNGEMVTFTSAYEAISFANNYDGEHAGKEYYVIQLHG